MSLKVDKIEKCENYCTCLFLKEGKTARTLKEQRRSFICLKIHITFLFMVLVFLKICCCCCCCCYRCCWKCCCCWGRIIALRPNLYWSREETRTNIKKKFATTSNFLTPLPMCHIFVEPRKSVIRNYHFCKHLYKLAPKSAAF